MKYFCIFAYLNLGVVIFLNNNLTSDRAKTILSTLNSPFSCLQSAITIPRQPDFKISLSEITSFSTITKNKVGYTAIQSWTVGQEQ